MMGKEMKKIFVTSSGKWGFNCFFIQNSKKYNEYKNQLPTSCRKFFVNSEKNTSTIEGQVCNLAKKKHFLTIFDAKFNKIARRFF